jgi:hypothetical protein
MSKTKGAPAVELLRASWSGRPADILFRSKAEDAEDRNLALEHFPATWIRFAVKKCGTPTFGTSAETIVAGRRVHQA